MDAHAIGLLGEVVQDALALALIEAILPPVDRTHARCLHGIDQLGHLGGSGRDGLVWTIRAHI